MGDNVESLSFKSLMSKLASMNEVDEQPEKSVAIPLGVNSVSRFKEMLSGALSRINVDPKDKFYWVCDGVDIFVFEKRPVFLKNVVVNRLKKTGPEKEETRHPRTDLSDHLKSIEYTNEISLVSKCKNMIGVGVEETDDETEKPEQGLNKLSYREVIAALEQPGDGKKLEQAVKFTVYKNPTIFKEVLGLATSMVSQRSDKKFYWVEKDNYIFIFNGKPKNLSMIEATKIKKDGTKINTKVIEDMSDVELKLNTIPQILFEKTKDSFGEK